MIPLMDVTIVAGWLHPTLLDIARLLKSMLAPSHVPMVANIDVLA
jgi:hypothetical protein